MTEIKEVYRNDDIIAYDGGFKDTFGNKFFVVVDETLQELRLYSRYKDFHKRRNSLNCMKFNYVWIPEYGIVINITETTKRKIENLFPGYKHTEWQVQK